MGSSGVSGLRQLLVVSRAIHVLFPARVVPVPLEWQRGDVFPRQHVRDVCLADSRISLSGPRPEGWVPAMMSPLRGGRFICKKRRRGGR